MAIADFDREQYLKELEAELFRTKQKNRELEHTVQILQSELVRYSKAFHISSAGIVITRMADGVCIDLNESFSRSLGYEKVDVIGKNSAELGIWVDPGERESQFKHLAENGFIENSECQFRTKSGELVKYLASVEISDINGEQYLIISGIDITKQKQAEEKFYKAFHENQVPMSITRVKDGVLIDANKNYAETMEYLREDIIGRSNYSELNICGLSSDEREEKLRQLQEVGFVKDLELQFRRGNGEIGYVITTHTLLSLNGELCRLASAIDITKRKQAEEALAKSERKFSTIFYKNNNAMAITRFEDGIIFDINDSASNLLGYKREDLLGKNIKELGIWGESFNREPFIEHLRNGNGMEFETKYIKNSGSVGTVLAKVDIMELDGIKYALISGTDITERKMSELALSKSQRLFYQVFNSLPLSIVIISFKNYKVVEVNDTFLTRNNVRREEIVGQDNTYSRFWTQPEQIEKYAEDVRQQGIVRNFEIEYRRTDTEIRNVLISGILIEWEGEECILSVSNDITELRQYENELSRLDNLNLMGQMAGSIAHEVRNPMTSIKGFLQLFQHQYKYQEDREIIELMIEELNRVNEIITTFLSLSQRNHIELKPVNLNDCVNGVFPLIMADAIKNDVFVDTEFKYISEIVADEAEIRQLLLNLSRNAIQAMQDGGNLTIKTFEDPNGVNLVVQDQGQGIPPEIVEKIGIPFLTTKQNGTGLGMAVCYSIAERHGAKITFETSSEGTSFKVTFPVAT